MTGESDALHGSQIEAEHCRATLRHSTVPTGQRQSALGCDQFLQGTRPQIVCASSAPRQRANKVKIAGKLKIHIGEGERKMKRTRKIGMGAIVALTIVA